MGEWLAVVRPPHMGSEHASPDHAVPNDPEATVEGAESVDPERALRETLIEELISAMRMVTFPPTIVAFSLEPEREAQMMEWAATASIEQLQEAVNREWERLANIPLPPRRGLARW